MPDLIPWSNLLPTYNSPNQLAAQNADIQQTQAQTGLLGAQTTGADIANQGAGLKLGMLQNYLGGGAVPGTSPTATGTPSGTQTGGSGETVGGFNIDPNDVTAGMMNNFAPIPTARPASVTAQMLQASAAGMPDAFVQAIGQRYDQQVALANQQRQLGANQTYQMAEQVASAPPGAAFQTFERYDPAKAAQFKAQHSSDDPEELDDDVRLLAQHAGIGVHQYTGRPTTMENGVLVDQNDGKPVLGSQQVLTGLDAKGKESAFAEANTPVQVGDQLPQPRWKVSGFPNAEAYVIAADKAARSSANQSDNGSASGAPSAPTGAAPAPQANAPATPAAPSPSAAPAASGSAPATADPVLKTALADTSYRQAPLPKATDQETLAANTDQAKANIAARQTLKTESDQSVAAAAQAQTYLQAAKSIIDSKGTTVGAYGGLLSKASALIGDYKGDASNYQELTKYLNNAAIAAAKGNYGSGLTEKELELQLTGASPSVDKTSGALSDLVNANLRNTKYTLDTAGRVVPYLAAGNDPTNFRKWNQQYYNQASAVNAPAAPPKSTGATSPPAGAPQEGASAISKSGKPLVFQSGHWQYQ